MIISALAKRYTDAGGAPPGWQRRDAAYALSLAGDGELQSITPLGDHSDKKTAKQSFLLPTTGSGRSGKNAFEKAFFLCDDAGYMLGQDSRKFDSAQKLHLRLLESIDTPEARAIAGYFRRGVQPKAAQFDAKDAATAKYVFMVNNFLIDYETCGEEIRAAWENESAGEAGDALCMITGERDSIVRLHDKITLRGVTMSKQPLISMNDQTSFRSYGSKPKDPPAQVGSRAAFAYATALNDLLTDKKHHQFVGGDTLVYWAEGGGENEAAFFGNILDATNLAEDEEETLHAVMANIAQGILSNMEGIQWERQFYVLCLSPNGARISVRFFFTGNFGDIVKYIAQHYANLEIYSSRNEKFHYLPPWMILSETTVKKSASDAAPLLGGQLMRSIVTGSRYPATLYNAILARIRAGEDINRTKAAVVKATLLRNYESKNDKEVLDVALSEKSENKPYVLGRLFAVLEKLQQDTAGGRLNSTMRDKYFASACANPQSVFPSILRRSISHERKLTEAGRIYYGKLKQTLMDKLDIEGDPYPATLNLQDQGKFILGYYHQTQAFYVRKDKTTAEEETTHV
jgi:CRISPR-associated protein Csd1